MRVVPRLRGMDLVLACRAFVAVADRGSFTHGAAAAGTTQPIASRRVAALERHVGGQVLDRAGRRPVLTPLGSRLLPAARRLVSAAEDLALDVDEATSRPVHLQVPRGWGPRVHADLELAGRDHGIQLAVHEAGPAQRAAAVGARTADVAVVAAPPDGATWSSVLGTAGAVADHTAPRLDLLRPRRGPSTPPRLWLLPEDDVPHVRDVVVAAADAAGLAPSQVVVAGSPGQALAAALDSRDLVLASAAEATRWELAWTPLESPAVRRGHDVVTDGVHSPATVRAWLGTVVAAALGVEA